MKNKLKGTILSDSEMKEYQISTSSGSGSGSDGEDSPCIMEESCENGKIVRCYTFEPGTKCYKMHAGAEGHEVFLGVKCGTYIDLCNKNGGAGSGTGSGGSGSGSGSKPKATDLEGGLL